MKKMKWLGGLAGIIAAAVFASFAVTGCELELSDKNDRAATSDSGSGGSGTSKKSVYVALGGENTFKLSSVTLDDAAQSITHSTLAPSAWNAISEFERVKVEQGSTVKFTFTQPTPGSDAWNSWALAIYDNATVASAKGQFLRADNWLNESAAAGFAGGLWKAGGSSANGEWSNGYTYETCGKTLPTDATVVVSVTYDGTNVTITETVNGETAYTTVSSNW